MSERPTSPVSSRLPADRPASGRPAVRGRWAAALLGVFLLAGCFAAKDGGGSETTVAGISGKVVDASGNPVAGAAIRMRPEGALPPGLVGAFAEGEEVALAHTRADGSFLIKDIAPGDYVVECRGQVSGAALLSAQVTAVDTLLRLPDAVLLPTGAVRGKVLHPPESLGIEMVGVYVYIPGLTERALAKVADSMVFVLDNLPVGRYALRVQPPFPMELSRLRILEVPDVEVRPGDTTDLGSLEIPLRGGMDDSAYIQDSLAVEAVFAANGTYEWVRASTAVTGNRITSLHDFNGQITRIPADISRLDRLEILQLMGSADSLRLEADPAIARVRGLKRLLFSGYHFDSLPDWARSFRELAGLRLQRAKLTAFPLRAADYAFLTSLDLQDNAIPAIPPSIGKMQRLRVLNMSGNELASLPAELMAMEGLKGFRARNNRLCDLSPDWKVWVTRQDSLWKSQADPLSFWEPGPDLGWEASQRCGSP